MSQTHRYCTQAVVEDLAYDLLCLLDEFADAKSALVAAELNAVAMGDYRRLAPHKATYAEKRHAALVRLLEHCGVDAALIEVVAGTHDAADTDPFTAQTE